MDSFFKDISLNRDISWEELLADLNAVKQYNPYCFTADPYEVFKCLITSMLMNCEIILLDANFSKEERLKLTGYNGFSEFNEEVAPKNRLRFNAKEELIEQLKNTNENWRLKLFSSGTTGLPKEITHTFKSITRLVKQGDKFADNIWGFAYNPTHMAGVQVFLQAVLNGNTLVYLFGKQPEVIYSEIMNSQVTHISATPSFYKLLPPTPKVLTSITKITSGGEKFSGAVMDRLRQIFPNAKMTNIYASTEVGAILSSENEHFIIEDKYRALISIDKDELCIHRDLMPEKTNESEEWYRTGDLVEQVTSEPLTFRFLSRESNVINVGGYNVYPGEVEELILKLNGIQNVRVFGKSNSLLGNIICCEVVSNKSELSEQIIKDYLTEKLQPHKVPRIIKFVEELKTNRTGKMIIN